jgi:hypothetical protein
LCMECCFGNVLVFICNATILRADDLVDFSSELKLSFLQLGISHQISASIVMQVQ